jgi:Short C-terminal domain/PEGA domain
MRVLYIVMIGALLGTFPILAGELDVRIETVPAGATVEQAGRVLGRTPLTLKYPTGYFQPRATVWGAYLGAPLEFTFTLAGYQPKVVKLGRGPFPWRNLYGAILYEHYLLDRAYQIELLPHEAQPVASPPIDQVGQLERLAALRAQGVLTEEEFKTAKARVLVGQDTLVPAAQPKNQLAGQDPAALCWRLVANSFSGSELAKLKIPSRQESTATDGSDRQIIISCSWELAMARPTILSVSIACGDDPNAAALCSASGQQPAGGNPPCLWGTEAAARAIAQPGCLMAASLTIDQRRSMPPGIENAVIDMRDVLRTMAGRIMPRDGS